MIRLLIVDDSSFFRYAVRAIVEPDGEIEVVGEAVDGEDAVAKAVALAPDVITMDVEMPGADGFFAVERIMARRPRPIIMVSNLTIRDGAATVRAMGLGAVDYVAKKSSVARIDLSRVNNELLEKIHFWGPKADRFDRIALPPATVVPPPPVDRGPIGPTEATDLVVVGVSTGGPALLPRFLGAVGPMEAPMVIAQHMPERFTLALADTLTARTGRRVFEVAHGQLIGPGDVAIAPGGRNLTLLPRGSGRFVAQVRTGPDTIYKPSVDLLFTSAATVARAPVGVALTGMGDDGARGARVLTDRGAAVFAQEPSTCLIDGMPKSAIKIGGAMGMTIEEMGEKFATMWRTSRESIRANGERS